MRYQVVNTWTWFVDDLVQLYLSSDLHVPGQLDETLLNNWLVILLGWLLASPFILILICGPSSLMETSFPVPVTS